MNISALKELGPYLHRLIKTTPGLTLEGVSAASVKKHYTNLRRKLIDSTMNLEELDLILNAVGVSVTIVVDDQQFSSKVNPAAAVESENTYLKRIDDLQQQVITLQEQLLAAAVAPKH